MSSWGDYRRRWGLVCFLFLGFIPTLALLDVVLEHAFGDDEFLVIVAVVWIIAYGCAGIWLGEFPCPRCGNAFFSRKLIWIPWSGRCLHCDWPKWKDCNEDERSRWAASKVAQLRAEEEVNCLQCGEKMEQQSEVCSECGWSFGYGREEAD